MEDISILLPPPYQTNCKNYDLDGKQGYKFRTDCVNHCIHDGLSRECADHSIDKTYDWKACLEKTDLFWRRESFNNSLTDIKLCPYWKDIIYYKDNLEIEIKIKLNTPGIRLAQSVRSSVSRNAITVSIIMTLKVKYQVPQLTKRSL